MFYIRLTADSQAAFKCAIVDCPERMNSDIIQEECIQQYTLDNCCLANQVCGKRFFVKESSTFCLTTIFYRCTRNPSTGHVLFRKLNIS